MSKAARTIYYKNDLILITTEEVEHIFIDDNLFDFRPKNFRGSPAIQAKFAELYQSEKENVKTQIMLGKWMMQSLLMQEDKDDDKPYREQ